MKFRKAKGITLISLVITIVILLILAVVSIGALAGDNGLIARAQKAKNNTLDAQNLENTTLADLENLIETAQITGIDTTVTDPITAIPKGATIIEGDATKGIVIKDSNENEWVWVEVPKTIYTNSEYLTNATTPTSDTDYTNIEKIMKNYTKDYRNSSYSDTWYSEEQYGLTQTEYNELKQKMLTSVYDNGGFWIGRYEAGNANATASNTTIVGTRTDEYIEANSAVIKADQIPYNYVTCKQAQILSKSLATGGKTSSLMFGIQWDLTCKFLEEKTSLIAADIKTDSTGWGNYSNAKINLTKGRYNTNSGNSSSMWTAVIVGTKSNEMLLTTGASEDVGKMNIYDFAGNEFEWTLEQYINNSNIPCTSRGGCYYNYGFNYPASDHLYGSTSDGNYSTGFRTVLY